MPYNVHNLSVDLTSGDTATSNTATPETARTALEWDWDVDYEDRKLEEKADAAFQIDRKVLKDVVKEKMGIEVGRINFLSSGQFQLTLLVVTSADDLFALQAHFTRHVVDQCNRRAPSF